MFIRSTINPLTQSSCDVPILVLRYGESRKFIQRPESYEGLVLAAKQKFGLSDASVPNFTTSTLDICKGNEIEVDAEVYLFLHTTLDEVGVDVVEGGYITLGNGSAVVGAAAIAGPKGKAVSTNPQLAQAPRLQGNVPKDLLPSEEDLTDGSLTPRGGGPGVITASKITVETAVKRPPVGYYYPKTPNRGEATPGSKARRPEITSQPGRGKGGPVSAEGGAPASPRQNRVPVPKQQQQQQQQQQQHPLGGRSRSPESSRPPSVTSQGPGARAKAPKESEPEEAEKKPKQEPGVGPERPLIHEDPVRDRVSRAFEDRNHPLPSATERALGGGGPTAPLDGHFNVRIRAPDESEAEFKTRGKHTIRKVLSGACSNFGLDYDRARLLLVLDEPEDGQDLFYCDPEESLTSCGIWPNALLVIHVEPESESEEDARYPQHGGVTDDLLEFS